MRRFIAVVEAGADWRWTATMVEDGEMEERRREDDRRWCGVEGGWAVGGGRRIRTGPEGARQPVPEPRSALSHSRRHLHLTARGGGEHLLSVFYVWHVCHFALYYRWFLRFYFILFFYNNTLLILPTNLSCLPSSVRLRGDTAYILHTNTTKTSHGRLS